MSQPRSSDEGFKGQFQGDLRPNELLPVIRKVCDQVEGVEDFTQVTTSAFDVAAMEADAGLPKAKSMCQRLRVSWAILLLAAHASGTEGVRLLGVGASDRGRKGLRLEDAQNALRRMAISLGQPTVTETQYTREREEMLRRAGRSATGYSGAHLAIPSINQIAEVMAQHREKTGIEIFGWDELLESAGLKRRGAAAEHDGLTPEQAVEAFADYLHVLPGGPRQLQRWARLRGLSLAVECRAAANLKTAREAFNSARAVDGMPPLPNAETGEVDWDNVKPAETQTRRTLLPRGEWTKDRVIVGLALALKRIGPNETLKQRSLNAQAPKDPMIPGYSTVERAIKRRNKSLPETERETFDQWRREASELARATDVDELRDLWARAGPVAAADQQLIEDVNTDFAALRADPEASAEFDAETEAWDATSLDSGPPDPGLAA